MARRVTRSSTSKPTLTKRQRRQTRRLAAERLESRRLLAADISDDLTPLSDEFDDPATLANWSRIHQTEGWNADQLQTWDIDGTQPGRMTMIPHTTVWYQDYRGPLVYKELLGDFVVTTEVQVTDRDDVGGSDADDVPNDAQYSLAGLMVRTPREINSPADWTPGSMADDGTNNGENFVFLSLGHGVDGQLSLEVKSTRNSSSELSLTPLASNTAQIQIARVGDVIVELYRTPGEDWTVHRRYFRDDMPETVQVGMVSYTDWSKASDYSPLEQNSTVLQPGVADPTPGEPFNPDLEAGFEYTRFARPVVPTELQGVDLLNAASDQELLSFLGDAAIPNPVSPTPLPSVGVVADESQIPENGGATQWVITRDGDSGDPLHVFYSLYGSADADDYQPLLGEAVIPAGELSAAIDLIAADDALAEGAEDVVLQLTADDAYLLGVNGSATVTLLDDDLPSIGDQTMTQGQGLLQIPLTTELPDGTAIEYAAMVIGSELAQWNATLELGMEDSYHLNWGGEQEKWITSPIGWHYLLPDGSFYQWGTSFDDSALLATFDAAVYDDPSLLHEAQPDAAADVVAGELVIQSAEGFVGSFDVEIVISHESGSSLETISVDVTNQSPTLAPIAPIEASYGSGPVVIALEANDLDNDALELSAHLVQPAYELDQELGFATPEDYFEDWNGHQEKWIQDSADRWHYLLPSGGLYRWQDTFEQSELLAELGPETYQDPTRLTEATPLPVTAEIVGETLTITPGPEWAGQFEVVVRANDGAANAEQSVQVAIMNQAPSLAPIGDQVMSVDQLMLALPLLATDPEDEPLQITARVVDDAYDLDQELQLWSDGEYHLNWGGQQEKWIRDGADQWLYLLPTGALYRWAGTFDSSMLIAELGQEHYADPALLTDAQPSPVNVQWTGAALQLTRPAGYQTLTRIRVTVSDGFHEVSQEFWVTMEV